MSYQNFTTGFNKPAIFTAQTYGTKTTVEIDHSDLSLDEVMDAFQTLLNGMGYHSDGFKQWVLERAAEFQEEEDEKWEDVKTAMEQDDERYENLRHSWENKSKEDDEELPEWMKPNDVLIDAKKQYDEQLKMNNTPVKKRKKKTVEDWENEIELGGHE